MKMLMLFFLNALTETPEIMCNQVSGHPVFQRSQLMKLAITSPQQPLPTLKNWPMQMWRGGGADSTGTDAQVLGPHSGLVSEYLFTWLLIHIFIISFYDDPVVVVKCSPKLLGILSKLSNWGRSRKEPVICNPEILHLQLACELEDRFLWPVGAVLTRGRYHQNWIKLSSVQNMTSQPPKCRGPWDMELVGEGTGEYLEIPGTLTHPICQHTGCLEIKRNPSSCYSSIHKFTSFDGFLAVSDNLGGLRHILNWPQLRENPGKYQNWSGKKID